VLTRSERAVREVRTPSDLEGLDGLVLPGGESTTMTLGIQREGLAEPLRAFAARGTPVLGTCAGLILLDREHLGVMDIVARATRSAASCTPSRPTRLPGVDGGPVRAVFIRALDRRGGARGRDLAAVDGQPVAARQGNLHVLSFHPELGDDDGSTGPSSHACARRWPPPVGSAMAEGGSSGGQRRRRQQRGGRGSAQVAGASRWRAAIATAGSVRRGSAATAGKRRGAGSAATAGSVAVAGSAATAGSVAVAGSVLTVLGVAIAPASLAGCSRLPACVACIGCVGLRGLRRMHRLRRRPRPARQARRDRAAPLDDLGSSGEAHGSSCMRRRCPWTVR
jgi:5'-phosphate synthase pdxT subunit